jgi:protein-tyrosine phosphatase
VKTWIADRFGSPRGLVRHLRHQAAWRLDPRESSVPPLEEVQRLVFVCKGNICRSAMAEAVARAQTLPACSFGTRTQLGKPANPGMLKAAAALGYDLSAHRTTPIEYYAPLPGDLVLVFEPPHLRELRSAGNGAHSGNWTITLLGLWARPQRIYIHDPFGSTPKYYGVAAAIIRNSVVNLVAEIRKHDA